MKIMVPFSARQNLKHLLMYGSDIELYAGFNDNEWTHIFGTKDQNKMTAFGNVANLNSIDDFVDVVHEGHKYGISVFLTLNGTEYSDAQIEYIKQHYLPRLRHVNVDGIIIGDEGLIDPICKSNIKPIASTIMGIYNQLLVSYYKKRNVHRQIIPRDISINDITQLVCNNRDVEFEVFLMRNGCKFSDSHCLCTHGVNGGICGRLDRADHYYSSFDRDIFNASDWSLTDHLYSSYFHRYSCALCGIWRFLSLGVHSAKIVGRADDPNQILYDLEITISNLHIAEKATSEEDYLRQMLLPSRYIGFCRNGYSCYYPEIRFGGVQ